MVKIVIISNLLRIKVKYVVCFFKYRGINDAEGNKLHNNNYAVDTAM